MKLLDRIRPHFPQSFSSQAMLIFVLLGVELILFATNYTPGTYFLGWDNLFPQLNFGANFQRSIFSVWQEYRGLGILDGMSFSANLPHYIFTYLTSLILPQSVLRYFFFFLMHFLGGLGIYFLLGELFRLNPKKRLISLLGSLFYLLNLTTIQMFYAPYEVFAVHFAFLPFLILFTVRFFERGLKKDAVLFAVFSFLSIPQAHVPTVFLVYFLALLSTVGFYLKSIELRKILVILFLTFSINAFWGLPYVYTALTSAGVVANSKINQMSTEDDLLKNKARGDLKSVALLEGFWLDYTDSQPKGNNDWIMPSWRAHTDTLFFSILGFLFFLSSLAGIFISLRRKDRLFYPFIFLFIVSFLILGSDIPILNLFSKFLSVIPYFSQVFRFTFTKFSILYIFSFTIFVAYFLSWIFEKERLRYASFSVPILFIIFLSYLSYPAFKGNFLYQNTKVKIPQDYFMLVNYFKNQNNGRIAILPQPSYWGWTYTNWGYRGSGFIWYGIPQATTDGAFFPWSRENENYYWEISYAINSSNQKDFDSVISKYNINWLVLDHSIVSQYSSKATSIENLERLIKNSQKLNLAKTFGGIDVYKVNGSSQNNFVSIGENLPNINSYNWNNQDIAYLENADYISSNKSSEQIFYPLRSLFTGREQKDLEFGISDKGHYFLLNTKIPTSFAGENLILPKIFSEEVLEANDALSQVLKYPQLYLDNEIILTNIEEEQNLSNLSNSQSASISLPYIKRGNFEVRIPKIEGFYSFKTRGSELINREFKNCNPFVKPKERSEKLIENSSILRLTSLNSDDCFSFDLPSSSQRLGFLVRIRSRNIEGKSLLFAVINKNSQRPDLETNLPESKNLTDSYFVIPPMEDYGAGYNLYFDNASIGNNKTVNDLESIEVHPIPYRFLTSIKVEKNPPPESSILNLNKLSVFHPNPSLYEIKLNGNIDPNSTLILSQSYNPGWKAYEVKNKGLLTSIFPFWFSNELSGHSMVNNWANSFALPPGSNGILYIVYWPQYLEYLGFIVLLIVPIYLFKLKS